MRLWKRVKLCGDHNSVISFQIRLLCRLYLQLMSCWQQLLMIILIRECLKRWVVGGFSVEKFPSKLALLLILHPIVVVIKGTSVEVRLLRLNVLNSVVLRNGTIVVNGLCSFSHLESINQTQLHLILFLLLSEVFKLSSKHASHHVPLKAVDVTASGLELSHHLFDLAVSDQTNHSILVFHESHWIVIIIIRI